MRDRVTATAPGTRHDALRQTASDTADQGREERLRAPGDAALPPAPVDTGVDAVFEEAAEVVVDKPWGREIWWARTDRYAAKLIEVRAGHQLSLQYHLRKQETHLYLCGSGRLEVDGRMRAIAPGLRVTIDPGALHRVTADTDVRFVEVSSPELDDVVRVEDRYGRATAGGQR